MFTEAQLNRMTESDVREEIINPFLQSLGYRFGAEAYIRRERQLRYDKMFLGRKNPVNDPPLRGRADYECGVVAYGRWIVEAKSPIDDLTQDDSEQAYSYAAHPEIAALYYLLANGRDYKLYRIGEPGQPILEWKAIDTDSKLSIIRNIIGPDAIKKRAALDAVDSGYPLADGLRSSARILGGWITYDEHKSSNPNFAPVLQKMSGSRAAILEGSISRTADGFIQAEIKQAGPYSVFDAINKAAGFEVLTFKTTAPEISRDANHPNILDNFGETVVPKHTYIPSVMGIPAFQMPFDLRNEASTEVTGFLEGEKFKGTFIVSYKYSILDQGFIMPQLRAVASLLANADVSSIGSFEVNVI